jgi:hypothetical protein
MDVPEAFDLLCLSRKKIALPCPPHHISFLPASDQCELAGVFAVDCEV